MRGWLQNPRCAASTIRIRPARALSQRRSDRAQVAARELRSRWSGIFCSLRDVQECRLDLRDHLINSQKIPATETNPRVKTSVLT